MFKTAYKLVLLLLPLNVLTALLVPALHQRAAVEGWLGYGFDACPLPCWAGIVPGETQVTDALDRLSMLTLNEAVFEGHIDISFSGTYGDTALSGRLLAENRLGEPISGLVINAALPVSALIEQLGMPSCLQAGQADSTYHRVILLYWGMRGQRVSAMFLLTPDDALTLTSFSSSVSIAPGAVCTQAHAQDWSGFAPAWHYERQQP